LVFSVLPENEKIQLKLVFKCSLFQLSVLKADITSVEANCYVNPSSSSVSFVGQVGGRLAAVGGKVLQDVIGEFRNQIIPPNGSTK
jgi:O-acetyl-ADP-ribose deacetylase (regulator of RNase III)